MLNFFERLASNVNFTHTFSFIVEILIIYAYNAIHYTIALFVPAADTPIKTIQKLYFLVRFPSSSFREIVRIWSNFFESFVVTVAHANFEFRTSSQM